MPELGWIVGYLAGIQGSAYWCGETHTHTQRNWWLEPYLLVVHWLQLMNPHWYLLITQNPYFTLERSGFSLALVHSVGSDKCVMTCILHYSIVQFCHCPKTPLCSTNSSLSPPILPRSQQPLIFLLSPQFLPFSECYIAGVVENVAFSDWLLLLSNNAFNVPPCLPMSWELISFWHWIIFHGLEVYLSVHLLKDIMIASKFWKLWIKLQ